jgi:hypothetical protein
MSVGVFNLRMGFERQSPVGSGRPWPARVCLAKLILFCRKGQIPLSAIFCILIAMKSNAQTVEDYLKELPEDRKDPIKQLLEIVRQHLPKGYEEAINWGMICWQVPLSFYPDTYNKQPLMYAALASQKNYMALYLMRPYAESDHETFREQYIATGKKLDMGKGCVRFKKLEDLPLDFIGEYIGGMPMEEYVQKIKTLRARVEA